MRLVSHGGWCCGISTLYGFEYSPETVLGAAEPVENAMTTRSHGEVYIYNGRWTLPEQTALERAKFLIEKKKESLRIFGGSLGKGLIEAVLTSGKYNYEARVWNPVPQISVWGPILEELGFKPVTEFYNSNSSNTVTVYHLVY